MSLRDFNEPFEPLHHDPAGNDAGLGSFHTTSPQDRAPSGMPKLIGGLAVVLMVGAAGIGLYAYSGSSQPQPVVADNNLPRAQASAPIAPPPAAQQAAANTPADTTAPAATPAANDGMPAPVKEAATKPVKAKHHVASVDTGSASSQAPAQQAAVAPSAPPPAAPQPSPSDLAATNAQSGQAVPQGATTASDMPAQNNMAQQAQPAPQQPSAPVQ